MKNKTKLMCKDKTWDNIYMARLTQFINLLTDETISNVSEPIKVDLMAVLEWQLAPLLVSSYDNKWINQ